MSAAWAPYFSVEEMRCPCCHRAELNKDFMLALWAARRASNTPMPVTSGYRCADYNRKLKGKVDSHHLHGRAVDIACTDSTKRAAMVAALLAEGLTVMIYPRHLHVDMRGRSVKLSLA